LSDLETRLRFLDDRQLPAVVVPECTNPPDASRGALARLLETRRADLAAVRHRHGAVLFRGFEIGGGEAFAQLVERYFGGPAAPYVGGTSPRQPVAGHVYESTRFPHRLRLPQHNEMSYLPSPPRELLFFCEVPPQRGGETPLADSRLLYRSLPEDLRSEFETRGVRYSRHYLGRRASLVRLAAAASGIHRSWREAFGTEDRAAVERQCRSSGLELRWDRLDAARVSNRLPATAVHPVTGETVWFNQAATLMPTPRSHGLLRFLLYHAAYPDPGTRPFHVCFGDGGAIARGDLERIQETTDRLTVTFPWQRDDLLLVDNFLVTHGRMPFRGERRILVAMK
jgi:alpha-ketoglutarate-dependent taurine dioxygenase